MIVKHNQSLKPFHTFGLDLMCSTLVEVSNVDDLMLALTNPQWLKKPEIILGKGSNVLFTENFEGVVIINRLQGKIRLNSSAKSNHQQSDIHLHIAAGEDWPSLVLWSLQQGYTGLENLALIPGCAGSAPIQNIGAYGVELKDVCEYVEYLDKETLTVERISAEQCQFGYRDSIFKNALLDKVVITAIGLKLSTAWQPVIDYGPLQQHAEELTTAMAVYDKICEIRCSKLPDPNVTGNAGSFFKNPVISEQKFTELTSLYSDLNGYPVTDAITGKVQGVKIAAGWLIDRCGLKGHAIGGAQVHSLQALVLINADNASASDVLQLAQYVKTQVMEKYGVLLEHEVRFMGATCETNLATIFE